MASNLKQIKTDLKILGAKTIGNKPELLHRLNIWQNLDLSGTRCPANVVPSVCQQAFTNDEGNYAGLEELDRHHVEWLAPNLINLYFRDRDAVKGDQQSRRLFYSLFCKSITFNMNSAQDMYFKIKCSAETKKSVDYDVRLHLNKKETAIMKATCTCPAGKGTSSACKHIGASLYAIEFYGLMGEIKVNKSCTELLQTWHQPKPGRNLEKVTIDQMVESSAIDVPPPNALRTDDFINSLINFGISCPAVYSRNAKFSDTFHDHDYCKSSPMLLRLNDINFTTEKDRVYIEKMTRSQGSLWKTARKSTIFKMEC